MTNRYRRNQPERETTTTARTLKTTLQTLNHNGAAALKAAVQYDTRGYPRNTDQNRTPTGTHSDPTAHTATRQRQDPYDTLADDLIAAHDALTAACHRYDKLAAMALADADPINTCHNCNRKVTGNRDNRLKPSPTNPDVRICETCRSTERRQATA